MVCERIPLDKLEQYAESTARSLPLQGNVTPRRSAMRVERALRALRRSHERLSRCAAPGEGAARWLLDNWYLALREGMDARQSFRAARRLRASGGRSLVLCAAAVLLRAGSEVDEARCHAYLRGFQKKLVLTRRELALFPAALRAAAVEELAALYAQREPDAQRAGALFTALRLWSGMDFAPLLEAVDRTEQILRADPAGVYPLMDEASRADYRREVERLAARRGIPEYRAAQRALRLARAASAQQERHVGWWLYRRPLGDAPRVRRGGGYIAACVLTPLFLALLGGFLLQSAPAALLLLLPLSQLVKSAVDLAAGRLATPRRLPRMELLDGVPAEGRTLAVISLLLTGERAVDEAVRRLEEFRLASRDCGENLLFGLLADLPESDAARAAGDEALLQRAARGVEALNARRGGGFFLLTRERVWNRDTGRWGGWERKRGAVTELARLLAGEESALRCDAGSRLSLRGARYILTLDADTRLTPGTARALIGAMLHPLNRPVVDAKRRIVTAGHGVIQPRIATELAGSTRCDFARVFAPQGGSDPYGGCAGEVYMDLFASGGFAGKGVLDARALLACLDGRIPEGRVLSHDALEGAFLRGGLLEDAELLDGFPASPLSYYRREHRWVRGDWQNLPWLFRRGRELPPIERWRLFDSLRRSLVAPATLAALLAALFFPTRAFTAAALTALVTMFSHLLFTMAHSALRPEEEVRVRVLSGLLHGASGAFTQTLTRLLLLPHEAWTDLSAALTALWRMGVTRRDLLEWQTAAQSDKGGRGVSACARAMVFTELLGLACLLAPTVTGKAAGVVWLLAPLCMAALGRARGTARPLSAAERNYLMQRAGEIWSYFETYCTAAEHYLPPDNVQEQPPVGPAHRTSPTNIGLAMVSALCAADLGVCPKESALALIERQLDTLESLPKWRGHLYNWYDTRTLRSLQPAYISTVDSGNLAGCLMVLRQGLLEYGCRRLAARAQALGAAMDFAALYDARRGLFRIGLAPDESGESTSWYDLLESEERLTGYIAIASGQVPLRHWRRLSRAQVECDGFRGCASWSGTMFEYLMPELFLPLAPGSLLWESARFCLYVQKKRRMGRCGVWGKSESAFYALDAAMNYRYKAHGCAALALCRGMDAERVAAPYAAFLALMAEPRAALDDLRRFEALGALGPWGFWEAVDFTPGRGGDADGLVVRCVMAHHLGMSMAAIANVLTGGICRRRFMADPAMAAYESLLQEKVPLGGLLLRRRDFTLPERQRPCAQAGGVRLGEGLRWGSPACQPLSNGVYSALVTESGLSRALWNGLVPYRAPRSPMGDGEGMSLLLRTENGETLSLLPRPGGETAFRWALGAGKAVLYGSGGGLSWSVSAAVPAAAAAERRSVQLRGGRGAAELFWSFEPALVPESDYRSHPAFARLGLRTETLGDALLVTRLARGERAAQYLACACSERAAFSSDFFQFPTRGALPESFEPNAGWQSAPLVTLRVPLFLDGGAKSVSFALCAASSREEALRGVRRALRETEGAAMGEAAARLLNMDAAATDAALATLPALCFPHVCAEGAAREGTAREALWRLGVSGDLPIVGAELRAAQSVAPAAEQLRRHAYLGAQGVLYDLVLLSEESGDYRRPQRAALEELLRRLGRENLLGARGGVHFAPLAESEAVQAAAALYFDAKGASHEESAPAPETPLPAPTLRPGHGAIDAAWDDDGGFTMTLPGVLPPRAWSHVLTNGRMGVLTGESGVGWAWLTNARECPITPWNGDALARRGPETLEALTAQGPVSLFADADGLDCRVTWRPGAAAWEKEIEGKRVRVTMWVPEEGAARLLRVECEGELHLRWCAPLVLAPEARDAALCAVRVGEDGTLRAENPRSAAPGLAVEARCSVPWLRCGTDRRAWLCGRDDKPLRCGEPCFAGEFVFSGAATLALGAPIPETSADAETTAARWRERLSRLRAETPEPALDHLLNGWCAYQALAGRILGRATLYQSGGAFGFRDQLQDYVNLIPIDAPACRAHILVCCAHQYEAGDVQHWWHPGVAPERGLRSRCSDDLLWLVWAVSEYVEATGDAALCAETAPYLASEPLRAEERTRFEAAALSEEGGSVLDHCRRALALFEARGTGAHGLPRILGGDWNDGLDDMGEGAESVWLAWFGADCRRRFAALLRRLGEGGAAAQEEAAAALEKAALATWTGERFPRGFYGDGEPLGGAKSVDAMAQAWAALLPSVDAKRADAALTTALRELWDGEHKLLRLCAPPYTDEARAPGYIASYGPGFRENGGQYTHAALFFARALLARNRNDEAWQLLSAAIAEGRGEEYGAEPYVLAADIYANPDCPGRAGWSWYTGAAGVFLRAAGELLGFRLKDGAPDESWTPHLPALWDDCRLVWRDAAGLEHAFGAEKGEKFTNRTFSSPPPRDIIPS